MKRTMLAGLCAGLLTSCQSLWGSLSIPNPGNCVSSPELCLADEICDQEEQICHSALSLHAITPALVPTSGGGTVKLFGERFLPGIKVNWDGLPIGDVKVDSATELSFTLPASQQGHWWTPIELVNPTGHSVRRDDLFSYYSESLSFVPVPIKDALSPRDMLTGDFTGDGISDIAFISSSQPLLTVLPGLGTGGVRVSISTVAGTNLNPPRGFVAEDLNRDGNVDLLVAVNDGVQVFFGNGKGAFTPGPANSVVSSVSRIAGLKLDRDQTQAVALSDFGSTLVLVPLGKDGTAGSPITLAKGFSTRLMTAADISGDGLQDLLVIDTADSLRIFVNDGTGKFVPSPVAGLSACTPTSIATADLDHDAWDDVVLSCKLGLQVLHNDRGTLTTGALLVPTIQASARVLAADLSGDGWPELVYGDIATNSLYVLQANRKGSYLPPLAVYTDSNGFFSNPIYFAVDDMDGNHKPDVVAGFNSAMAQFAILRNESP